MQAARPLGAVSASLIHYFAWVLTYSAIASVLVIQLWGRLRLLHISSNNRLTGPFLPVAGANAPTRCHRRGGRTRAAHQLRQFLE